MGSSRDKHTLQFTGERVIQTDLLKDSAHPYLDAYNMYFILLLQYMVV